MSSCLLCIVVYGRSLGQCETINAIVEASKFIDCSNLTVLVWNNGPSALAASDFEWFSSQLKGAKSLLRETLNNESLAKIYNLAASIPGYTSYGFLDHDSKLSIEYIEALNAGISSDLAVPMITVGGKPRLPKINGEIISSFQSIEKFNGKIRTVLSGLVISTNLLDHYKQAFGSVFDERYALYGVDTSFFLRLDRYVVDESLNILVIPTIAHSLSRLELESDEIKRFRRRERGLDLGITVRQYPGVSSFGSFLRELAKTLLMKPTVSWRAFFQGFIVGIHPRMLSKAKKS